MTTSNAKVLAQRIMPIQDLRESYRNGQYHPPDQMGSQRIQSHWSLWRIFSFMEELDRILIEDIETIIKDVELTNSTKNLASNSTTIKFLDAVEEMATAIDNFYMAVEYALEEKQEENE